MTRLLWQKVKGNFLMKVKAESGKASLKLNIQKITSWHSVLSVHGKYGKTMETVKGFIFLSFKIAADGDCNHEIKRCLLFGRKAITILDSIFRVE